MTVSRHLSELFNVRTEHCIGKGRSCTRSADGRARGAVGTFRLISLSRQPLRGVIESVLHRQELRWWGPDRAPSIASGSDPERLTPERVPFPQGVTSPSPEDCGPFFVVELSVFLVCLALV